MRDKDRKREREGGSFFYGLLNNNNIVAQVFDDYDGPKVRYVFITLRKYEISLSSSRSRRLVVPGTPAKPSFMYSETREIPYHPSRPIKIPSYALYTHHSFFCLFARVLLLRLRSSASSFPSDSLNGGTPFECVE